MESSPPPSKIPSKRGRKPKTSEPVPSTKKQSSKLKSSDPLSSPTSTTTPMYPLPLPHPPNPPIPRRNIILHLKCNTSDLQTDDAIDTLEDDHDWLTMNPSILNEEDDNNPTDNTKKDITSTTNISPSTTTSLCERCRAQDIIQNKTVATSYKLHMGNIPNTRSCCFWCHSSFNTSPVYLAKDYIQGVFSVYGKIGRAHV